MGTLRHGSAGQDEQLTQKPLLERPQHPKPLTESRLQGIQHDQSSDRRLDIVS